MASHNEKGVIGEFEAQKYLLQNDFKIFEKNWRFEKAEIDLIAEKDNKLIFIEVKTRSTDYFGNPADFVGPDKEKNMIDAAEKYIELKNLDLEIRFDIIEVIGRNGTYILNHIEEAFRDGM